MSKVALVTGASRGIGRGIAERLARDGVTVAVNYKRSRTEAEAVAASIGGLAVQADIADLDQVRRMFAEVEQRFGRLDILVNNAGIALFSPVVDAPVEDFDRLFAINVRGLFFCLQEGARRIGEGGRIVNLSSGATVSTPPGSAVYAGSKAAVEQFTRAAARELGPRGVTVNTVSPGFTETEMLHQFPQLVAMGPGMSAFGRLGTVEDVADVVAFLCSGQARWITGQNIQAGGGASMS